MTSELAFWLYYGGCAVAVMIVFWFSVYDPDDDDTTAALLTAAAMLVGLVWPAVLIFSVIFLAFKTAYELTHDS